MPATKTPPRRTLRPVEIEARYGIPQSTLHFYCEELPKGQRLPSLKLPGKRPRLATSKTKGVRLVYVDDLETWLNRWRAKGHK